MAREEGKHPKVKEPITQAIQLWKLVKVTHVLCMSVLEWVYVCASVCVVCIHIRSYTVMPMCVVAKGWQVSFLNKSPSFYRLNFWFYMCGWFACMPGAWCLEDKEGIGFLGTGVTDGYELSCRIEPGLWKHSQCSEPSLQPLHLYFLRQGFSLSLKFIWFSGWMAKELQGFTCCYPNIPSRTHIAFYRWFLLLLHSERSTWLRLLTAWD